MCGIIGIFSPTGHINQKMVRELIEEVSIRGRHASGYAYANANTLVTKTFDKPGDEVELPNLESANSFLFHCRYSTSDLNFNQPLVAEGRALCHNGVVSQQSPDKWYDEFGIKTEGNNDSELILRAEIDYHNPKYPGAKHPIERFPKASMAVVTISTHSMHYYRNEQRPLHWAVVVYEGRQFTVVASTREALKRIGAVPNETEACVLYSVNWKGHSAWEVRKPKWDLQK